MSHKKNIARPTLTCDISQDRYLEEFSKMVPIAHQYNPNAIEKEVMVFVADEALQREATEAGAKMVGGEELIEEIKKGRVELVSLVVGALAAYERKCALAEDDREGVKDYKASRNTSN